MEIEITRLRLFLIMIILGMVLMSVYILGQAVVGHRASDLIGQIPVTAIGPDSISSAQIRDYTIGNPLNSNDFADDSFITAKLLDNVVTSVKIRNLSLTGADLPLLTGTKIYTVQYSKLFDPPNATYAMFGYNVPIVSTTCNCPYVPFVGIKTLDRNPLGFGVGFDGANYRVGILYNWTVDNSSTCTVENGTIYKFNVERYWFAYAGWGPCSPSKTNISLCP